MRAAMQKMFAAVLFVSSSAFGEPGQVVQPELVVPGEWLTDRAEKFLFLPFEVPKNIPLDKCKLMTNGEQLLIVVTERPEQEPDTLAMKKYKLVVGALKKEAGHDEGVLEDKLRTWLANEDDEEVRVHIQSALDSLVVVKKAKSSQTKHTLTVPLGLAATGHGAVFLGRAPNATHNSTAKSARNVSAIAHNHTAAAAQQAPAAVVQEEQVVEIALASVHRLTSRTNGTVQSNMRVGIIKESFAVEIPYPVDTFRIFVVKADATTLIAGMPLVRESLAASGISTGGKPFERVPVFSPAGLQLAGPAGASLKRLAFGLHVPTIASGVGTKRLTN